MRYGVQQWWLVLNVANTGKAKTALAKVESNQQMLEQTAFETWDKSILVEPSL